MVESLAQKAKKQDPHPQLDGISEITDKKVLAAIDKVIEKIVRVSVQDGRVFIGILKCVDQTKTLFV